MSTHKKRKGQNPFIVWSSKWKRLQETKGTIEEVVKLWKEPLPKGIKRISWKEEFGYRKNNKQNIPKGEQIIEKALLRSMNSLSINTIKTKKEHIFLGVYNDMRCASDFKSSKTKGQVIADAFGILVEKGSHPRPIVIEVKFTNANPWFALVENLKQIRLLRNDEKNLKLFLSKFGILNTKGTWGMVLAPKKYFTTHKKDMKICKELLEKLKKHTKARVAFCISDNLEKSNRIKKIEGNWKL